MKKIYLIFIILLFCYPVAGEYTLEDYYDNSNCNAHYSIRNQTGYNDYVSQTFTPSSTYNLSVITLNISKISSHTGSFWVYIYGVNGTTGVDGRPNQILLATSEPLQSEVTTTHQLVNFTFAAGYTLTGGLDYTIVTWSNQTSGQDYNVGADTSSATHPGNLGFHTFTNSWNTWTTYNNRDVIFYTYSYVPDVIPNNPNIISYTPIETIYPEVYDMKTFNITVDQSVTCVWYVNNIIKQTDVSSFTHTYTNLSLSGGECNITAIINNNNGSDIQTWIFEVGSDSISYTINQYDPTNQSMITQWDVERIGNNVTDWGVWLNHTFIGWQYYLRFGNGLVIMNQIAAVNNDSLWFNGSSLLPIGTYFIDAIELGIDQITLYNNEYSLINNWETDQTYQQISNNISGAEYFSYYNQSSGLWESYRSDYTYNENVIIPKNCSIFMFVNDQTTINITACDKITIPQDVWFYGYLPGVLSKTINEIKTEMNNDGLDVFVLYGYDNSTQTYITDESYSISPNEGFVVYCNVTGEYNL